MVPSTFVRLDALPLSPNGKIDRRSLPAPVITRPDLDASFVAPSTDAEQMVAEIWQEVLGRPRVGLHDNFFDLGGHSLLLARVHAELRERAGVDLTLIDLFKHPTVSALAQALTKPPAETLPNPDIQVRAASRRDLMERQRQLRQRTRPA
jgi:aryl carrier-like protein